MVNSHACAIQIGDGGAAVNAQLNSPQGIGILSTGAIVFSDTLNHCIRKIENGIISTLAGNGSPGLTGKFHMHTHDLLKTL